jgi:hypothetical protein
LQRAFNKKWELGIDNVNCKELGIDNANSKELLTRNRSI